MIGIAWLPRYTIFWQSLVGLVLTGRAWVAMQYSAKLCLTSSLPTICTIPNYLHYSQLFATTLPNYSLLFALFPTILTSSLPTICTIPNYLHYSQLFALFSTIHNYCSQLFPTISTIPNYSQVFPTGKP